MTAYVDCLSRRADPVTIERDRRSRHRQEVRRLHRRRRHQLQCRAR
jgi:hypothetical protein